MSSIENAWEAAAGNPFYPVVSKERQFFVGFTLLLSGMSHSLVCIWVERRLTKSALILTGLFGLSMYLP